MKKLTGTLILALVLLPLAAKAEQRILKLDSDCPIKATVLQRTTATEDYILVIYQNFIHELPLKSHGDSRKQYTSVPGLEPLTFEAIINQQVMSSLSYMNIYLSGREIQCYLDV